MPHQPPRLAPPPAHARQRRFHHGAELFLIRAEVRRAALAAGVPAHRIEQLLIAVNELATNTIEHGAGQGTMSVWTEPGRLICRIHDDTSAQLPPPAAWRAPAEPFGRGHGLALARDYTDAAHVHRDDAGNDIELHLSLPATIA